MVKVKMGINGEGEHTGWSTCTTGCDKEDACTPFSPSSQNQSETDTIFSGLVFLHYA